MSSRDRLVVPVLPAAALPFGSSLRESDLGLMRTGRRDDVGRVGRQWRCVEAPWRRELNRLGER